MKNKTKGFTVKLQMPTSNNLFDHSGRAYEADIADKFLSHHAVFDPLPGKDIRVGYTTIEVLEFLKGKPWNNLAYDALAALRPSAIRATTGKITADSMTWRVTVYLEEDKRTIRRIEQEVAVGKVGVKTGYDFAMKLGGYKLPPPSDKPMYWMATR